MAKQTYYDELGVNSKATREEIDKAWLAILSNMGSNRKEGKPNLVRLELAYSVLSDPTRRAGYDHVQAAANKYKNRIRIAIGFLSVSVLLVAFSDFFFPTKQPQALKPESQEPMTPREALTLFHGELLKPRVAQYYEEKISIVQCDWEDDYGDSVSVKCTLQGNLQAASKYVWYQAYDLTTLTKDKPAVGPRVPAAGQFEIQIHVPKRTTYYVLYLR